MFSVYRWVVFVLPLEGEAENAENKTDAGEGYTVSEACSSDIDRIIDVYPKEFFTFMPRSKRDKILRGRSRRGCTAFVLSGSSEGIIGGAWALPVKHSAITGFGGSSFELVNTFVIASKRGAGLGSFLRKQVIREMAKRGYSYMFSYVWRSRKPSIRMNLSTGSRIFAEKKRINLFGFHWTRIIRPINLCGIVSLPQVILTGFNKKRLLYVSSYLKKYGFFVDIAEVKDYSFGYSLINSMVKTESCVLVYDGADGVISGDAERHLDKRIRVLNNVCPECSFEKIIEGVKMNSSRPVAYIFRASGERSPVIDLD